MRLISPGPRQSGSFSGTREMPSWAVNVAEWTPMEGIGKKRPTPVSSWLKTRARWMAVSWTSAYVMISAEEIEYFVLLSWANQTCFFC